MSATTISARVPQELRDRVDEIAQAERRTMSNVVELALESFVRQYTELHPKFREDIAAGLEQMRSGDVVPYERG